MGDQNFARVTSRESVTGNTNRAATVNVSACAGGGASAVQAGTGGVGEVTTRRSVVVGGGAEEQTGGVASESIRAMAAMSTALLAQQLPPLSKFDGTANTTGDKETIKELSLGQRQRQDPTLKPIICYLRTVSFQKTRRKLGSCS